MKSALTRAVERKERMTREELRNGHSDFSAGIAGDHHRDGGSVHCEEAVMLLRASLKARADILEWEAAELEFRVMALRANASKIRSEAHVAE